MLLLSTQLFGDKTAARVPLRWIPFFCDVVFPSQFVCRPYMTPEVAFVADASIWRPEHMIWGVQNAPHRLMNIDWLHARDGRGGDRWFPSAYQLWHGLWYSRHDHTFTVDDVQDLGPSTDYFRWWFLAGKWYLAHANPLFPRPPDEIPLEAFDRVADTQIHIGRPERRRMVGTRTTARDWQWVDEMLGDDVPTPRRARRMPEGGDHKGGRRGGRAGGRSDPAHGGVSSSRSPSVPPHGGASSSQAHQVGTTQQSERTLQQIMTGDTVYRPYVDGSHGQMQVDLNEPASHPSQMFMTYAGTPPSAYMQEPYVVAPEIVPDPAPDDPTEHDRDGDEGAVPMGRGQRVHRRRGCGTGGHM
ncbi:hypothetical protein PIB30_074849 [Stylosanthes scabra]|uniref:Aminotransferase-like plant mobile domain-containing protein n=1 Tax=Stylosanthes scabra TaxID=79078 RepID=A0ABU6SQQ3_9FABA|nr:hypothetical protein [Stylosanthes scabra]